MYTARLNAYIESQAPTLYRPSASSTSIVQDEENVIRIKIDEGATLPTEFADFVFSMFTLSGSIPIYTKSLNNGITIEGDELVIAIDPSDTTGLIGRYYIELVGTAATLPQLLSGYLTIIDSRG